MQAKSTRPLKYGLVAAVCVVLISITGLSQWRGTSLRQFAETANRLHLQSVYQAAEVGLNLVRAREALGAGPPPDADAGASLYLAEQAAQQIRSGQVQFGETRLRALVTELVEDVRTLRRLTGTGADASSQAAYDALLGNALLRAEQIKRMHQIWYTESQSLLQRRVRRDWMFIAGAVAVFLAAFFALVTNLARRLDAANAEREAVVERLTSTNDELSRFTYTVSHDLKSPLITVVGFSQVMTDELESGNEQGAINAANRIRTSVAQMAQLLDGLLKLSQTGRTVKLSESVSMSTLASMAVESVQPQDGRRAVPIHVEPDMPIVHADPVRLREAIQNLVENAVKFIGDQPDPLIRIGCRATAGGPVFYVADNGVGIAPEDLERIFDLFERLETGVPGTGIGLALARRIVEAHGGRLWAESEGRGRGSTFCFELAA